MSVTYLVIRLVGNENLPQQMEYTESECIPFAVIGAGDSIFQLYGTRLFYNRTRLLHKIVQETAILVKSLTAE